MTIKMFRFRPTYLALGSLGLLLAACDSGGNIAVRDGPQAVHPSTSVLARGGSTAAHAPAATKLATPRAATGSSDAEALFSEFCRSYATARQSESAIRASGRFGPASRKDYGDGGTRIVTYNLTDGGQGSVSVGYRIGTQCSVSTNTGGATLYNNGSVSRP